MLYGLCDRSPISQLTILRLGTLREVKHFQQHLQSLGLEIPCHSELISGAESPRAQPIERAGILVGNRIAVQPMEGWMVRRTAVPANSRSGDGSALAAGARN